MKAVFLGLNALGDTLCTTPALRAFRRENPETTVIYVTQSAPFCRVLDNNPDIDLVIYNEQLYFSGLPAAEQTTSWLHSLPIDLRETSNLYRFDLRLGCSTQEVFQQHISACFARLINVELDSNRPSIFLTDADRRGANVFSQRPYVVFNMHSVSNPDRADGLGKRKDWPIERWQELARRITATGEFTIFVIGAERDPRVHIPDARQLYGLPIRTVAALLESATCVVTLENGIGHLCSAVGATMVMIYPDMLPLAWAKPSDSSRARVLYGDPLELSCDQVFSAFEDLACAVPVGR